LLQQLFGALARFLGVQPQAKKVWFEGGFEADSKMLGVNFHLDATPMYCSVPEDKVVKASNAIQVALETHWVLAEHCQVLLGILTFHGRILLAGKWHLSFSVQGLKLACEQGVAPMVEMWDTELRWWLKLLQSWNRASIIIPRQVTSFEEVPFDTPLTDASRSKQRLTGGAGAVFKQFYMMFKFTPREVANLNIMELEGVVVVLWLTWLCENHPGEVQGKRFLARCDNEPFVVAVNDRHSTIPTIAFLLGQIHNLMSRFSFDFRLRYIKSKDNVCADALSRDAMHTYHKYMRDNFHMLPSQLVCVPVQTSKRSSFMSSLISMRHSSDSMRQRPGRGRSLPTSATRGSAGGTARN
jgi:hypothetical protein